MRYWIIMFLIFIFANACQEVEVHTYIGDDFVQFEKSIDESYSFVYAGSTVVRDTIWLPAFCTGSLRKEYRSFSVKQIPEYSFEWRYDDSGDLIDSVLVKQPNQAEEGIHYVSFDDSGYRELCKVNIDSVTFSVPIIVLRDLSLQTQEKTLLIEFQADDNFKPGDPDTRIARIVLSDMIVYPEAWSAYTTNIGNIGTNPVLGLYGKVKHQLLIDVTGKPWDNEFIDSLSYPELLFYKNLAARELARINAIRAENGELPLREDPNNPNSVVEFP